MLACCFLLWFKKYHHQAYQIWREYKQQHIVQLFQTNLLRGIQSGLYRPDVNPFVTARLYVGQLQIIYSSDLFPPEEFNLQETYQVNLKHFMLGIVSAEGLQTINRYEANWDFKATDLPGITFTRYFI